MPDTLNLIEDKMRNSLELIGIGKDFLNRVLMAQSLKTINKWCFMKLKRSCKATDTVIRTKCQATEWEISLPIKYPIKG